MKSVVTLLVLIALAVGATYWRYHSFDPCEWLKQDMMATSEMPGLVIEGQIRGEFLLDGIAEPGFMDCLKKWWNFKAAETPAKS
ncbi:MAG: hypothetical protein AAF530_10050 [Pseudomonadota bacterium]